MKQYIFLIAMLFAAVGSTQAQRDVPAALIHLKNGTVDTVYMDNFSSKVYGVNNPQDDDYVKTQRVETFIDTYISMLGETCSGLKVTWQMTDNYPSGRRCGLIVSNIEGKELLLARLKELSISSSYAYPAILLDSTTQTFFYSRIGTDGITSYIKTPEDGTIYYIRPFCNDDGNYVFGTQLKIEGPLTHDYLISTNNVNYEFTTNNTTIAISYDPLILKQKYPSVLTYDDYDELLKSVADRVINNAYYYIEEFKDIACKQGEYFINNNTKYKYYVCKEIPASVEKLIIDNIKNIKAGDYFTKEMSNINDVNLFYQYVKELTIAKQADDSSPSTGNIKVVADNMVQHYSRMDNASNTFLVPSDDAWTDITAKAKSYYNYIPSFSYMDIAGNTTAAARITTTTGTTTQYISDATTMSDSISKEQIVKYLAFSDTVPANKALLTGNATDSPYLQTQTGNKLSNVSEILSSCGSLQSAYFGHKRLLNSYCFKPWETYCPTVISNKPYRTFGLRSRATYSTAAIDASTLSDDVFSEIPAFLKKYIINSADNTIPCVFTDSVNFASSIAKPEMDFQLKNLLSTKYRIYVVVAPTQLIDNRPSKPLYMRLDMAYTDSTATQRYSRMNVPEAAKVTDNIIVPGDGKFHAVAIDFDCPICYYGLDAFPTLFVSNAQSFTTSAKRRTCEQMLRIVGVYAVPMEEVNNEN